MGTIMDPESAGSRYLKRINEQSWHTFYNHCPGWVLTECESTGVPWFGIRPRWIVNELGYRMLRLITRNDFTKSDARSFMGPPYVLVSDMLDKYVEPIEPENDHTLGKAVTGWQWPYIKACFRWRISWLIKHIYWMRPYS